MIINNNLPDFIDEMLSITDKQLLQIIDELAKLRKSLAKQEALDAHLLRKVRKQSRVRY